MSTANNPKGAVISAKRLAELRAKALQNPHKVQTAVQVSQSSQDVFHIEPEKPDIIQKQEVSEEQIIKNKHRDSDSEASEILDQYEIIPNRLTQLYNMFQHNSQLPPRSNRGPEGDLITNNLFFNSDSDSNDESGDIDLMSLIGRSPVDDSIPRSRTAQTRRVTEVSPLLSLRERIEKLQERYKRETIIKAVQPATHFNQTLEMSFLGAQLLDADGHPPFMNNNSVASTRYPMFFLADRSGIRVYANDPPSGVLEDSSMLYISTKPEETTEEMRNAAVYRTDPHNITRIIVGTLKDNEREVLVASCDSGRVVVYDTRDIYRKFRAALNIARRKGKNPDTRGTLRPKHLYPRVVYQVAMSAWGMAIHPTFNLLAVACNQGQVYIYELDRVFNKQRYPGEENLMLKPIAISPQLPHNIPDVDFIVPDEADVKRGFYPSDAFYVVCSCISGHAVMWEFFRGKLLEKYQELIHEKGDVLLVHDASVLSKEIMKERINIQKKQQHQHMAGSKRPSSASSRMDSAGGGRRRRSRASNFYSHSAAGSLSDLLEDNRVLGLDSLDSYEEEEGEYDEFQGLEKDASDILDELRLMFPDEKIDPLFLHIPFDCGRWITLEQLRQDGWSISSLKDEDFLPVNTLYEISGNKWFNDTNVFKQQSTSLHKQYSIPGLNRRDLFSERFTSNSNEQLIHNNRTSSSASQSPSSEIIPLNQEFIDFSMRFSYFLIYTTPVPNFDQSWKYIPTEPNTPANDIEMSLASSRRSSSLSLAGPETPGAPSRRPGAPIGDSLRPVRSYSLTNPPSPALASRSLPTGSNSRQLTTSGSEDGYEPDDDDLDSDVPMRDPPSREAQRAGSASFSNVGATLGLGSNNIFNMNDFGLGSSPNPTFLESRFSAGSIGLSIGASTSVVNVNSLPTSGNIGVGAAGVGANGLYTSSTNSGTYLDTIRTGQRDVYIYKRNSHIEASEFSRGLLKSPPLNNQFLFLTSAKSVHLVRAETLISNASQGDIFECSSYMDRASASFDRLSIVVPIPGLNAIAVASQLGAVTIFRLVKHKSVYSMRQEYVFPVHEIFVPRRPTRRAITGLAVSPIYGSFQDPKSTDPHQVKKYRLTITYLDGFMLAYELKDPVGERELVSL